MDSKDLHGVWARLDFLNFKSITSQVRLRLYMYLKNITSWASNFETYCGLGLTNLNIKIKIRFVKYCCKSNLLQK